MKNILFLLISISLFAQPKKIYFFGDSITYGAGVPSSQSYPTIVANSLGMTKVNYAIRGTCMMSQTPSCRVDCRHMEYFADNNGIPTFNPETDALIFIAYLTNDVGINLPNYTIENFGKAIDKVIQALYDKGWNKENIKFNVRYYIENSGLSKYPSSLYGWFTPATLERYNAFAQVLKDKLDIEGIQYFDHYESLSKIEYPYSHLPDKVHPDAYFHSLIAKNIIENIKLGTLSVKNFQLDDTFTNIDYYNLLGQKVKDPKGIVIVKAKKNGIVYTKKSYF
jgi:lysophospholipase L1-like esterase